MHTYHFRIADIPIALETDRDLALSEEFTPFVDPVPAQPRYLARIHQVPQLPPIPEAVLHETGCDRVHSDGRGGYPRSFFDAPRDPAPYSLVTYDYPAGLIDVPYLEKGRHCLSQLSNSFYHLGLEEIMLRENRLCFHAACISSDLGGLLFAGPSGVGKSTQANLWCRYRMARLLNGDRPILSLTDRGVLAWGSPYAGSSRCYVNECTPVRAILLLKQAPACALRPLPAGESLRRICAGLNLHTWDSDYLNHALDLATQVITRVPVYEFSCTADESAVQFLANALKEGINHD